MESSKGTVLIIEDERLIAEAYAEHLLRAGYRVLIALDGKEGLDLAIKEKPDVIILDLLMPKMSGHDVLRHLKEGEETKNIPIIVLTNIDERESVVRVLEEIPTYYMVKANTSLEHLTRQIDAIIAHRNTLRGS